MRIIRPNCRSQFTSGDLEFVREALGLGEIAPRKIAGLFHESDSLDQILDNPRLFRALLDVRRCLSISMHCYFYLLVRHVLLREGIRNREVADYVAEVLAEFAMLKRLRNPRSEAQPPLDYFYEMLEAMQGMGEGERFAMQSHIANYALFYSGVFRGSVQNRTERRGAPDIRFYEEMGSSHYRMAGGHALARQYDMVAVFTTLSEAFHIVRIALNHLSEQLLFLETQRAVNDLLSELDLPGND